jgi:hypothetical protein
LSQQCVLSSPVGAKKTTGYEVRPLRTSASALSLSPWLWGPCPRRGIVATSKKDRKKKKWREPVCTHQLFHVIPIFSDPKSSYTVTKVFSEEAETTCERTVAYCVLPLLSLVPVFLVVRVWSQATSWYARCFLPRAAVHPHALGETVPGPRAGSVPISLRCNLE